MRGRRGVRPRAATSCPTRRSTTGSPRVPAVAAGMVGAYLGMPLTTSSGTAGRRALRPRPRARAQWSEGDVALRPAARRRRHHGAGALGAVARVRGQPAALRAGDRRRPGSAPSTGTWSPAGSTWDDRLIEIFGYDRGGFDASIEALQRPAAPRRPARGSPRPCSTPSTPAGRTTPSTASCCPTGETALGAAARAAPLADDSGTAVRLLGAAYDTTGQRDAEARVVSGAGGDERRLLLPRPRTGGSPTSTPRPSGCCGRPREELLGRSIWEAFPAAVGSDFELHYRAAVSDRRGAVVFEAYYPAPLDAWYEVRAWRDPDGLVGLLPRHHRAPRGRRAGPGRRRPAGRASPRSPPSCRAPSTRRRRRGGGRRAAAGRRGRRPVWPTGASSAWSTTRQAGVARHRHLAPRPAAAGGDRRASTPACGWPPSSRTCPCPRRAARAAAGRDRRRHRAGGAMLRPGAARDAVRAARAAASSAWCRWSARGRTVGAITLYRRRERPVAACRGPAALRRGRRPGRRWRWTTPGSTRQQRRLAETLQRSLLTAPAGARPRRDRRALRAGRRRPPRSAGTGTTPSCSPAGPRAGRSATSSATTPTAAAAMGQLRGAAARHRRTSSGAGPAGRAARLDVAMAGLRGRHHGDRGRRPARADPRGAGRGRHPAPLVQRRPPAAAAAARRRRGPSCSPASAPT